MLNDYLKKIFDTTNQGDAREESYYPHLASLFEDFGNNTAKKKTHVTVLPKKTEAGNPDFRIWDGHQHIIGYIEAKFPGSDLETIENTDQLERYRFTFPNLILTDFYEFRLYRYGELIGKVSIGRPIIAERLKTIPPAEKEDDFNELLFKFFEFTLPRVFTSENLAVELAKRTRFLKDEIIYEELREEKKGRGDIIGFYEAFQKYLISGLSKEEFADLYSQTITYGLFAARTRANSIFNRTLAFEFIPATIGILRDVFHFISLGKLSKQMEVIIDDIAEVLHVADIKKILQDYYKKGRGNDPIIHFYETFLNKYDPETQEKRGVYYTPESVVNYIVKSLDNILKKNFSKENGFANTDVTVLDPAAGTLTFLAETTRLAISDFVNKYGDGARHNFIKDHILKNFYAFELMMAPYSIAHLKMSFVLDELGYTMDDDERFNLYLTNTLETEYLEQTSIPGMSSLSEESKRATEIKKESPILVIMGNPPYSVASYNKSTFIDGLMELYKKDVKDERNIQILTDDYVKFIRFCHWKIEQSGRGVIGIISKNTYLNASAFKGMRKQILKFFDRVYVLNLHGKLYEKTPEGGKDQNVFDIRVGTAILFLVKDGSKKSEYASLYYHELYGTREIKYPYLFKESIETTEWEELPASEPYFFFEKKNFRDPDLYNSFFSISKMFVDRSSGVKTHRDHFVTDIFKDQLRNRIISFKNCNLPLDLIKKTYQLKDNRDFSLSDLLDYFQEFEEEKIREYNFKPFSQKFIYYDTNFIDFDRWTVMKNFLLGKNLGLVIKKKHNDRKYDHCFVTDKVTDVNFLGGQSYVFPLYIYSENDDFFNGNKKSNIDPLFEESLEDIYNKKDLTEQIFYYTYAILHCNEYRNAFQELLMIDYPKIPFPDDYNIFDEVSKTGKELADLHLLRSQKLSDPLVKFYGQGNQKVSNIEFDKDRGNLRINDLQYFSNITEQMWEYEIGKNKPVQRWLKNRKGRALTLDESIEFSKITTAVKYTLDIQYDLNPFYTNIIDNLLTSDRIRFNPENSL